MPNFFNSNKDKQNTKIHKSYQKQRL